MIRSSKKRAFSLLELLVAFSLIALVSSLLGVNVVSLIKRHRFHHSIAVFREDLVQMQLLSISHGCDTAIKVAQKNGKFYYQCMADLTMHKGPLFSWKPLKGVQAITVDKKKVAAAQVTLFSSFRMHHPVCIGFHQDTQNNPAQSLWIDMGQRVLPCISCVPSIFSGQAPLPSREILDLLFDK
ncbi:MAG: type II secretion system protein [Chlamydiae bacterium]|nr:type II secretion system protein [Chlamydiota bacterium]